MSKPELSPINIKIQGYAIARDMVYVINIISGSIAWKIYRRYDTFTSLYEILYQSHPSIPACPTSFPLERTTHGYEQRRKELEDWLMNLMCDVTIRDDSNMCDFLQAEANTPPPGLEQAINQNTHRRGNEHRVGLRDFTSLKLLGKGSFGKVFLVRKNDTGDIFAMKVLAKDTIRKRNQIEHTRTERDVLEKVDNPFVVQLHYAFQNDKKLYMVLDFCGGGELFFHLGNDGKFSESRAKFYAAEILLALEHMHQLGIIYRDLKPENVLLDRNGHVKLADFGLSKEGVTSDAKGANSFCGTPEYLAPEILNRQGHGRAVDWWSLGALLFEMLTGMPPFYCSDKEKLFEKIKHEALDLPNYLSNDAKNILLGLMEKDPNKRLGTGEDDAISIKKHPFFSSIDWEALKNKTTPAPWIPPLAHSLDVSQFDSEFTAVDIRPTPSYENTWHGSLNSDIQFSGFTFEESNITFSDSMNNEINNSMECESSEDDDDDDDDMSDYSDDYGDGDVF